jgi:hypothetical protein
MALSQTERLILNDSIDDVDIFVLERSVDPEFNLSDFIAFKTEKLLEKYGITPDEMTDGFLTDIDVANVANKADRAANAYKQQRSTIYPSIQDQLDDLYHNGISGWQDTIKAVKDAHPKPTEVTP